MKNKILLAALLTAGCWLGASAQQVAVKTNLLWWATTTMNLGAEVALSDHSTLNVTGNYNPWTVGQDGKLQHWLVQPEYRYWFSGKFTRGFVGVHLVGGQYELGGFKLPYNIFPSFHTNHYKGWAVGGGVSYGYHFYLGAHWNLEAVIGVGYARTRYSRSDCPGVKISRNYFGPTQAGISIVYLFNSNK